ncbi:MAG: PEGA domain-containing protein [Candidatus Saccharibacteria bacterium]|nr:PEGA domain-containing protein [Candidatus Saccharibacteria bacterium]
MNPEAKRRRQSLKVVISEAIMVLAVAITVIILGFLVSGYWINSDLKVERQGMLQISSNPTGANVVIDNESSWLQRTNTSKVLTAGEHTITLTKEGYDSWSKTINISEGLLYRLHYPRLFLAERTPEKYLAIDAVTYATVSPDRDYLLLLNNTTKWSLVRLTEEKPDPRVVDISGIFSNSATSPELPFNSIIIDADWSRDGSHLLLKTQNGDTLEWVLLDVKTPSKSINLTREFSGNFSEIQIVDNSANNLLAVKNGNLHRIDTSAKSMSAVLVEKIHSFDHFDNEVVFTATTPTTASTEATVAPEQESTDTDVVTTPYFAGSVKLGDDKITELLPLSSPAKIVISRFYDEKYLTLLDGKELRIYQKSDLSPFDEYTLEFEPQNITVGHDGDFVLLTSGSSLATLDMEAKNLTNWSLPSESYGWLDDYMLYSISSDELAVFDYDGLNRRVLAKTASASFPVAITDNKWLYYFNGNQLVREWLVEH